MSYNRTTVDVWEIQGYYGQGWEAVTTETSRKDAKEQYKCYCANESVPFRIVKKREKKELAND